MQDGSASRRGFFVTGLATGLGVALMPGQVRAAVSRAATPPRRVAELPDGPGRLGSVQCELNETARFIFDRCDGARSIEDLARAVSSEYEVDLGTARTDAAACVAELREMGLVQ